MAGDLQALALAKAELLSARLKEVLSAGQDYIRAHFGLDLGLKPELYPTWVILGTAALGLLLLLCLCWAAVCGGALAGKKQGSPGTQSAVEPEKATLVKTVKPEEQKKRSRKKPGEKKNQSNGQPVAVAQVEPKVTEAAPKPAPLIKSEKLHPVQAPVQVKKNKKKTKTDVKPVQLVVTQEGKEPDDGTWETKVSNREKKQQRRKDKGPEDSGGPGGVETLRTYVETPAAPTSNKKNRGNNDSHSRNTGKGDTSSGAVSSSWREEPSVNGGGWTDVSLKIPGQMGAMDGTKWSAMPMATHYRAPPKRQSWTQDPQAAWSGIDGRMKTDHNPVSFSMLGRNTTDPISNTFELQLAGHSVVDDEWSGFNGTASMDPGSDWNAPVEHWGNYEEPLPVLVRPAPPAKEQLLPTKVSEDEKDTEDPPDGAAKSKKKRKKKKKSEEEAASEAQMGNTMPPVQTAPKPQDLPVLTSKKQNPTISSSQKKPEQIVEPPKSSQKKKVRRET